MMHFDFIPSRKVPKRGEGDVHEFEGYVLVPARVKFREGEQTDADTSIKAASIGQPFKLAKWILPPEITSLGKKVSLREGSGNSILLPWETVSFEDLSYPGPKG